MSEMNAAQALLNKVSVNQSITQSKQIYIALCVTSES